MNLGQVKAGDHIETLRLLTHRRKELVSLRTQAVGRLDREHFDLLPGGAKRCLRASGAKWLLASARPWTRKQLDQLAELLVLDKKIKGKPADHRSGEDGRHNTARNLWRRPDRGGDGAS